jgi:hypothetical protein
MSNGEGQRKKIYCTAQVCCGKKALQTAFGVQTLALGSNRKIIRSRG